MKPNLEWIEECKKEFIDTQCEEMDGSEDRYSVYENDGELVADWWAEKMTTLIQTIRAEERERWERKKVCLHEWIACSGVMCTSDLHNTHCAKCGKHGMTGITAKNTNNT
jgi:hypothetical protein